MKRGIVLGVLIVVGALSLLVAAQQQARVVEVEHTGPGLVGRSCGPRGQGRDPGDLAPGPARPTEARRPRRSDGRQRRE